MAGAEIVLAAGVERDICWQVAAEFVEEPDQPSEMIVVSMADDQCLDLLRIGSNHFKIVEQRGRRVPKA